jgi:hypothetical protein
MTQSSEVRKIRLVKDESGQELLHVLVSHEPQPWINLLIVVSLVSVFCLGILSFFIIDQYTEIRDLRGNYDLNVPSLEARIIAMERAEADKGIEERLWKDAVWGRVSDLPYEVPTERQSAQRP